MRVCIIFISVSLLAHSKYPHTSVDCVKTWVLTHGWDWPTWPENVSVAMSCEPRAGTCGMQAAGEEVLVPHFRTMKASQMGRAHVGSLQLTPGGAALAAHRTHGLLST